MLHVSALRLANESGGSLAAGTLLFHERMNVKVEPADQRQLTSWYEGPQTECLRFVVLLNASTNSFRVPEA